MSCFMTSNRLRGRLAIALAIRERFAPYPARATWTEVEPYALKAFAALTAANRRALVSRYGERGPWAKALPPTEEMFRELQTAHFMEAPAEAGQTIQLFRCLDYQCVERSSWYGSRVRRDLLELVCHLASRLPQVANASWDY